MKAWLAVVVLFASIQGFAQNQKPVTLRSILLEQLQTTHNAKDWFVPISVATDGLTAEQANWKDGKGNHSIGQLANHQVFWNQEEAQTEVDRLSQLNADKGTTYLWAIGRLSEQTGHSQI